MHHLTKKKKETWVKTKLSSKQEAKGHIEKFPCVLNEHCMFRLAEQLILHNFA